MLNLFTKKLISNYKVTLKQSRLIAVSNRLKRYCSIQQLNNEIRPLDLAKMYFDWLTTASKKMIMVNEINDSFELSFRFLKKPLLILKLEDQDDEKAQYLVTGGLLAKKQGTFTFYRFKGISIIALEHFQPKLPWWVYLVTQAPVHEFVMIRFIKKYQN
jgi:hypothetical protein